MAFLLRLLVALAVVACEGSRAPNQAPELPRGFCENRALGTPTRSTGECMCRYGCDGARCQRGQGMVWYSVADCPTGCRCLPPAEPEPKTEPEPPAVEQCTEAAPCEANGGAQEHESWHGDDEYLEQVQYEEPPAEDEDEDEPASAAVLLMEWVDDNGRLLFGGTVVLVLSCLFVPMFLMAGSVGVAEGKAAGKPVAGEGKGKAD